jgi:hypothetical protein
MMSASPSPVFQPAMRARTWRNLEKIVITKEVGQVSIAWEHFDIADVFGRRKRPRLSVKADIGFNEGARLIVSLKNIGRVSARAPYLAFKCSLPFRRDE